MAPQKRDASGNVLTIINTIWAIAIGTLVLNWIRTDLYPHLIADGSLQGDYMVLVGSFSVGVVMAAPSIFKARVVDLVEAYKEWNKARKSDD